MKTLHSLVAGFRPTLSIVRQRIALPLLLLGAGWLFVAGLSPFSPATTDNLLKVPGLESPAGEGRSANWRQAAFDPAHTAFNRVETILSPSNVKNLTQVWASPVGTGFLSSSPVVWEGKVYLVSGDGYMYAFDALTGATVWVSEGGGHSSLGSAAVGHGLVFVSVSGISAYDANTGAVVWHALDQYVRASQTLKGNVLYVASFDGTLTALDAETGTRMWSTEPGCCVFDRAPVVDGDRIFQMRTNGTLTAYDAHNGTQLWSKSESSIGTQAASGGLLFFNHYPNVVALDQATGEEVWTAPVLTAGTYGAPAVANGLVFVRQSQLIALDAATGAVVWSAPAGSLWGPTVANGVVYASGLSGEWDAFDERDGSLLWSVTVPGCGGSCTNTVPIVAKGTLYLAGPDRTLRAFRVLSR